MIRDPRHVRGEPNGTTALSQHQLATVTKTSKKQGRSARDEAGSSLIFALIFLVVSSLIVMAIETMAKNDLGNTPKFEAAHSLQYAANSAAELAVDTIRYNFSSQTLNASPPVPCWTASPSPSEMTLDGQSVSAWCTTRWEPLSASTRVVTIFSCVSTTTASECAAAPLLDASVTFDDYASSQSPVSTAQCSSTCGAGMTVDSWVFDGSPPTVTSVTPNTGSASGGTAVTITGTGFTGGAVVDFVDSNLASNVILAAAQTTVSSTTTIDATTPVLASGETYYVTVTTPEGTSVYGPEFN